jgi:hypothetical protein
MATPIRFAPVLIGKEAEDFLARWEQSLNEPLKQPVSKERLKQIKEFIAKQKSL